MSSVGLELDVHLELDDYLDLDLVLFFFVCVCVCDSFVDTSLDLRTLRICKQYFHNQSSLKNKTLSSELK